MYFPFLWGKEAKFITLSSSFFNINKYLSCMQNKYFKILFKMVQNVFMKPNERLHNYILMCILHDF